MQIPKWLDETAFWVVTVGALNVGLVALFNWSVLSLMPSQLTIPTLWVSVAIGAGAVVLLLKKIAK